MNSKFLLFLYFCIKARLKKNKKEAKILLFRDILNTVFTFRFAKHTVNKTLVTEATDIKELCKFRRCRVILWKDKETRKILVQCWNF
jgi:hypothetical protein